MDKQEAIEEINKLQTFTLEEGLFEIDIIKKSPVIDIISRIHEPQKVILPKFVADWIELCKDREYSLRDALEHPMLPPKVDLWLLGEGELITYTNQETFARAWFFGYEIEQEKLYYVNIPNVYHGDIGYSKEYGNYSFYNKDDATIIRFELTESEIKEQIEWAWKEGFVKEV
ncbi:phage protein [Streptococcus acidominimus]|uniref:Phage protein n=1 Tax=Streptococcus acidominimus TaxID=1326 RepID=A0A239X1H5_STRAI|nr:DUF1642 domain-containing protein [Streptococcus acidominimus]SNV39794.1 phage protein [Streptococcus acidominimus]